MKKITFLLLLVSLSFIACFNKTTVNRTKVQKEANAVKSTAVYPYLLTHPKGYETNVYEHYPLIIFLHGAGERGTDLELVKKHGPPKQVAAGQDIPAMVLSPQGPEGVYWTVDRLEETLKEVLSSNRVDKSRIYLTGLSMGGYGTWSWAAKYPEHFAAIAPICGGGEPKTAKTIKDIPTWVFHGAKDQVVPLSESERMVEALKKIGSNPKFTIYPEANHDSWTATYDNPEFYKWLFAQSR